MLATISHHYIRFFQLIVHPEHNHRGTHTTLAEAIVLTWPFFLVGKFTQFSLAILFFAGLKKSHSINHLLQEPLLKFAVIFLFFWSLWEILLYPVKQWLYSYVWIFTFQFYQRITKKYSYDETLGEDLTSASMTGQLFLIVPILGPLVQSFVKFYTLYRGLKIRMDVGKFASLCILASPALFGIILFLFSLFCLLLFFFFLF
jgi:hypothetical protein